MGSSCRLDICQGIKRQKSDIATARKPFDIPFSPLERNDFLLNENRAISVFHSKAREMEIHTEIAEEERQRTGSSDRIKSQACSGRCSARGEGLSHSRPTICGHVIKISRLSPSHLKCLQITSPPHTMSYITKL